MTRAVLANDSAPQPPQRTAQLGRLYLVPNTLDLGTVSEPAPPLSLVLPVGVIERAATLQYWVAENAKSARAFLKRVHLIAPLSVPVQQMNIQQLPRPPKGGNKGPANGESGAAQWLDLLKPAIQGHDLGLISEAGLPAVADPGNALVLAAHGQGMEVVALSGPSALMLALAASGLNGQCFAFVGYVPAEAAQRVAKLRELEQVSARLRQTQILIEAPYRNPALHGALLEALRPDTWLSVSCGLTLAGGWTRTLRIAEWRKTAVALPTSVPAVFCLLA